MSLKLWWRFNYRDYGVVIAAVCKLVKGSTVCFVHMYVRTCAGAHSHVTHRDFPSVKYLSAVVSRSLLIDTSPPYGISVLIIYLYAVHIQITQRGTICPLGILQCINDFSYVWLANNYISSNDNHINP